MHSDIDSICGPETICGPDTPSFQADRESCRPTTASLLANRPAVCNRGKSAIRQGHSSEHGDISCQSRQSCDVLGPEACYECRQVIGRDGNITMAGCDEQYPNMYMTEVNLSATLLAGRTMPHMSHYEIQQSVARGHISTQTGFREQAERIKSAGSIRRTDHAPMSASVAKQTGAKFFTNISDLNRKLNAPNGEKNDKYLKAMARLKEQFDSTEKPRPKFISPRRPLPEAEIKREDRFVLNFAPPLLPKVCQNVETGFFAGS